MEERSESYMERSESYMAENKASLVLDVASTIEAKQLHSVYFQPAEEQRIPLSSY